MYEDEKYSGLGAGDHMSGIFSGAQENTKQGNTEQGTATPNYETYQTGDVNTANGTFTQENSGAYANYAAAGEKTGKRKHKKETPGKVGFFRKMLVCVSMGLCFGLFAGAGFYAVQQGMELVTKDSNPSEIENLAQTDDENNSGVKLAQNNITVVESDVSGVVEKVMPAMVSIINNYTETANFMGQTYAQSQASKGSGIIVSQNDTELLIVTNYHVVADAEKLEVSFINETVAEANIKGTDADMDLAVIAVKLESLDADTKNAIAIAALGNSDDLKLGEPVVAIGNALGYGQSVTNGIISALNRELTLSDGSAGTFIQTNAAINFGNSGGALLNMNGEVIGINSSKVGGSYVEGMGYAIPISSASPIIAELMERQTREKVAEGETGYLGITLQEITEQFGQTYGTPTGIWVTSVEEGSGAQNAGILKGDIITAFAGEKIDSYSDLQKVLQYYGAGEQTTVTVMRPEGGEYVEHVLNITLGSKPSQTR